MKRSHFLRLLICLAASPLLPGAAANPAPKAVRPNFLWIIAEDTGPWLGCYGEPLVHTPHLDALARRGIRFTTAWAGGPACSPSRSSLFTGLYATSLGTETHREERPVPAWAFFTPTLREAGYYCSNNAKTDYNIKDLRADAWDANGPGARYTHRPPGQPFFHCYSSLGETHMSRLVDWPPEKRSPRKIPPAAIKMPRALPDEALLRDDRAWHLDAVETMDAHVGDILAELKTSGAAEDTIVFFFSDHGGCLPNGKGYASEWGFHVPLIIFFPDKFAHLRPPGTQPGGTCPQPVSFLDFAPTLFSLADLPAPAHLVGQAFAGTRAADPPREFLFAFRGVNGGAQGGRWDVVRTIRDERYLYTRNFLPFRAPGLRQDYHARMPGQQAWENAWREGRCDELQSRFWLPKPVEELYDLARDPEQNRNLAADSAQAGRLARLRERLRLHLEETGDIGFAPNPLRVPGASPTYHDRMTAAPAERRAILQEAWRVSSPEMPDLAELSPGLRSSHAVVRYWAACGLTRLAYAQPRPEIALAADDLFDDPEPWVRVAAAEAAVANGASGPALDLLWSEIEGDSSAAPEAYAALETLGVRAAPLDAKLTARHALRPDDFLLRSVLITRELLPASELFTPKK